MRPTHLTFCPSHLVPPATLPTPKTCLLSIEDTTATRWISECCSFHMCGYSRFVCLRISIVASTWVCLRSRKSFDVLCVNTIKRQSLAVQLIDENLSCSCCVLRYNVCDICETWRKRVRHVRCATCFLEPNTSTTAISSVCHVPVHKLKRRAKVLRSRQPVASTSCPSNSSHYVRSEPLGLGNTHGLAQAASRKQQHHIGTGDASIACKRPRSKSYPKLDCFGLQVTTNNTSIAIRTGSTLPCRRASAEATSADCQLIPASFLVHAACNKDNDCQ